MIHRRNFIAASVATAASAYASTGWLDLFDGTTLNGWKPSANPDTWSVRDGMLIGNGPASYLYYTARPFKNFEFETDVLTRPGANSGISFHSAFLASTSPKKGFEVQIVNPVTGASTSRERKLTGSLYALRNVHQALVNDNEWFRVQIAVRGKNIQIRINGILTVDYTEPDTPLNPASGRVISDGLFALECHDPGTLVHFRNIHVRPLPDLELTPGPIPAVDPIYRQIVELGANNYPLVDWHVHLKPGLGVKEALAQARRDGIYYGISANCGRQSQYKTEAEALQFIDSVKGQAAFAGMQAEGADWQKIFTPRVTDRFDYIFNDGLIWTDDKGRWTRIYRPADTGAITNPEAFVDEMVERTVHLLTRTPMDILAIPTFLPDALEPHRARLWTPSRFRPIVEAAATHKVAIEMSDRYRVPGLAFLQMAKEAGCKFTLGTGNSAANDLRRSEYGLEMIGKLKLTWQDLWVPTRRSLQ
jgi:hypothetical protein